MLREAHAVNSDHGFRARVAARRGLKRRTRQSRLLFKDIPVLPQQEILQFGEAMAVRVDEGMVEHLGAPSRVHLDKRLADTGQSSEVATRLHLMIRRADPRLLAQQHLGWRLRVGEPFESALPQRIERDDRNSAPARLLERVQHAWAVAADILTEKEDHVGRREIVELHCAHGHANGRRQRDGGGFMTHVGTVWQIVVAKHARHEAVHITGLVGHAARAVEHSLSWVRQRPHLVADLGERSIPRDRNVSVG